MRTKPSGWDVRFALRLLCIGCEKPVKVDAALLELTCLRAPLDQPYRVVDGK